jgi:tetratricopeptide (TPR) repeat protein
MQGVRGPFEACMFLLLGFSSGCTIQSSTSNHYLTAEKLWTEKNYTASVAEFDRVVKEAPNSSIGLQALWRASMTRTLFLNETEEALKGFETFLERAANSDLAPQAQQEMGEIYFTKLSAYTKANNFYKKLLESHKFSQDDESKFMYRIARGYFLTNQIKRSITVLDELMLKHPKGPYYDRAEFDLANAWYALGDTDKQAYQKALKLFQDLSVRMENKNHALYVESIFGQASTLEEIDQFDEAFKLLQKIENDYPAPNVIKIRMISIEDRKKKKRK